MRSVTSHSVGSSGQRRIYICLPSFDAISSSRMPHKPQLCQTSFPIWSSGLNSSSRSSHLRHDGDHEKEKARH